MKTAIDNPLFYHDHVQPQPLQWRHLCNVDTWVCLPHQKMNTTLSWRFFVGHKDTKPHKIPTSIRRPCLNYGQFSSRTPNFMQFLLLYADNSSVWTLGCVLPSIIRTSLYYGHSGILFSRSFYASLTNNFTLENISLILIDASREKFLSPLAVFPVFR